MTTATGAELNQYVIAMDIGGTHATAAAVALPAGAIVPPAERAGVDARGSAETILDAWAALAERLRARHGAAGLVGIGLAMPAPFDYAAGISYVRGQKKFDALYGVDVRAGLAQRLGLAPGALRFANDADCFLLGEAWRGAGAGAEVVMGVTLGTGLGAGFVRHGQVQRSGPGVPPDAELFCLPYRDGVAEDYISQRGILAEYARLSGGTAPTNTREVAERAAAGDVAARGAFARMGRDLAAVTAPWLDAFAPQVLVLGGNIARAGEWFMDDLRAGLGEARLERVRLKPAELYEDAALYGAAWLHQPAG
jgi:glucokinase